MKQFLFITDFDGTITAQDFFVQIINKYKPELAFFKTTKRGLNLLSDVFSNLNLSEDELLNEIKQVPFDPSFSDFVEFIKSVGGKVLILSAGARYYIENKLKMENLDDKVEIMSNESFYDEANGGIAFVENKNDEFYDEIFGINKLKVVQNFKEKFSSLAYAGDSYADFDACRFCDFKFAKNKLDVILDMFYIDHHKFENFAEIKAVLEKKLK